MNKFKILICAYSCVKDPDKRFGDGGEGILGWNIVKQASLTNRVWVLTHSANREAIEEKIAKELLPETKFYYVDMPKWIGFLNKFHGGVQLYAYLWQIKSYFVAKKLHKEINFDVFHHLTYANDWMASFTGAFLPVAYVRGPGGGAHRVPKGFLQKFSFEHRLADFTRSMGQWFFRHDPVFILGQRRAKAILVCNKEAMEAIPKKWQSKARFFPVNGISISDLEISEQKKDSPHFSVLTAGKLIKIKNFDTAIKAFKIFNEKASDVNLVIAGDGPEMNNLKNLVEKLKIKEKIIFKGWLSRQGLSKEMASCDIFLFASLRDGGGAVAIEAMAAGKPVVCLDIGGPGFNINEDCGIKVEPGSPGQAEKDMAAAMGKLYFDKDLRAKLGRAARERAEKYFSWDGLGKKMEEIYKNAVK